MISIDVLTLTLIVGTLIPLAVAILTKSAASSGVKAVVNVVLTAAAGAGVALLNAPSGGLPWQSLFIAAFATYTASGASYAHLWKPTGVAPALAGSTSEVGLGRKAA